MKRIFLILLCLILFLIGCTPKGSQEDIESLIKNNSNIDESKLSIEFSDLDDENLLKYIEDSVYLDTISNLDSDKYVVEDVQVVYLSKEFLEEKIYNEKDNRYFGFTIRELDKYFQGNKYIFTLDKNGETTVQALDEISDKDNETIIKNVLIGSGVILVCVTISVIGTAIGAPVAITTIFTASAKTATTFALSSSAFGAIISGITKIYETGDVDEAIKSAKLSASDGFMWGAISGVIVGGGSKFFALKSGTKSGLTMSEVAIIQKESKLPNELISQFTSMKEYEIYKAAGLEGKIINGRLALYRKIDENYVGKDGLTNLQRMLNGKAPLDSMGIPYELHHIGQRVDSPLAILTKAEHSGNHKLLHLITKGGENPSSQVEWKIIKDNFWKDYAYQLLNGLIP